MSTVTLDLSNLVTTSGALKLTQAEYDYLDSFLAANDRGSYYLTLYNMTGSQEALLQAEIATFSAGAGGAAWLANYLIKTRLLDQYPLGVHEFSLEIAKSSLAAIADKINTDSGNVNTGIITDEEMLISALSVWGRLGIEEYFPGHSIIAANELVNYLTSHGVQLLSQFDALSVLVNAVADSVNEGDTSLNNILSHLGTPGTLYAAIAAIGGAPLLGLQLEDFESDPVRYRIVELPDAAYKVVIDNDTDKVVAVSRFEGIPTTIAGVLDLLSQYWPQIIAARVGGLPGLFGATVVVDILRSVFAELRHANMDHNNGVSPSTPIVAQATDGDDTLWGEGGIISFIHNDTINSGAGDDRIFGGDGDDQLQGGTGNDIIYGQHNDDHLYGEEDDDILRGGTGNDFLEGNDGNDLLDGGDMTGTASGDDTLVGGLGNDLLVGQDGNDELYGNEGLDTMEGGLGNDTYLINDGDGIDTILDSDGDGSVIYKGVTLTGGLKIGENTWMDIDRQYTYTLSDGNLFINENLQIQDFETGDLGIDLSDKAMPTSLACYGSDASEELASAFDYIGFSDYQNVNIVGEWIDGEWVDGIGVKDIDTQIWYYALPDFR